MGEDSIVACIPVTTEGHRRVCLQQGLKVTKSLLLPRVRSSTSQKASVGPSKGLFEKNISVLLTQIAKHHAKNPF